MAAAAVIGLAPLVVPIIKPLIESLVTHVEHLFGAKTGPTKFQSVLDAVTPILAQLSTAGKIPGTIDTSSVQMLIESVVQELKATGVLNPSITIPPVISTSGITQGTSVKVTGTLVLG